VAVTHALFNEVPDASHLYTTLPLLGCSPRGIEGDKSGINLICETDSSV
jgi:hypothetical protein